MMDKDDLVLLALYNLSNGNITPLRYEDVVVDVYKKHPNLFHLKGYEEYPDSETIKKRLYYSLKRKGYTRTAGGYIELTKFGVQFGKQLFLLYGNKEIHIQKALLSKFEISEYNRIIALNGFKMFLEDRNFKPLDIDIYDYYKITVRTSANTVIGKVNSNRDIVKKVKEKKLSFIEEIELYMQKIESVRKELFDADN